MGYGFVIYQDSKRIAQVCERLGLGEFVDAEVEEARAGLHQALRSHQSQPTHFCTDNSNVNGISIHLRRGVIRSMCLP
ncbi:hypothetical protein CCHR01_10148 [Colletotrichum chrysophilum]|uniref:Uncharacterized protein n=1 Tax=Colletotrichum chrysophilum TaxID=1836956 RepID=A0AAD9EJM8_9PEZI|nr:hypothetical protein CCHR01_10148 [Colletotrichum chrysophilum]